MNPATNRLYENTHPELHGLIEWYKPKEDWVIDFRKVMVLKNITPDLIIKTLELDTVENQDYACYLEMSVKNLRETRRRNSLETREKQSREKMDILKGLLLKQEKMGWTHTKIAGLMDISRQHFYRLKKVVDLELADEELVLKISCLGYKVDKYIRTKQKIREMGYKDVPKYEFGNVNHINKLLRNYSLNLGELKDFLMDYTFTLQMLHSYQAGKLHDKLSYMRFSWKFDCEIGYTKKRRKNMDSKEIEGLTRDHKRFRKEIKELNTRINLCRLLSEYKM